MSMVVKITYVKEEMDVKGKKKLISVRGIKEGDGPPRVDMLCKNVAGDDPWYEEAKNKVHEVAQKLNSEVLLEPLNYRKETGKLYEHI